MLVFKYTCFAVISTVINLLTQKVVLSLLLSSLALYVAMALGTLTGLVSKYYLDKHYIFNFKVASMREDGQTFMVYSIVGVFTTAIFWSFELAFVFWFDHPSALYLGGAIGLALGYLIKYQLDKRYVFVSLKQS